MRLNNRTYLQTFCAVIRVWIVIILGGLLLACMLLEQHPPFCAMIFSLVRLTLEEYLSVHVSLKPYQIRVLGGMIDCRMIKQRARNGCWRWDIDTFRLRYLLGRVIREKTLHLVCHMEDGRIDSAIHQGSVALLEQIKKLVAVEGESEMILIEQLQIKKHDLLFEGDNVVVSTECNIHIPLVGPLVRTLYGDACKGKIAYMNSSYAEDILLTFEHTYGRERTDIVCSARLPAISSSEQQIMLQGQNLQGVWNITLHNKAKRCKGTIRYDTVADTVGGDLAADGQWLLKAFMPHLFCPISSTVAVHIAGKPSQLQESLQLHLKMSDVRYGTVTLPMMGLLSCYPLRKDPVYTFELDAGGGSSLVTCTSDAQGSSYKIEGFLKKSLPLAGEWVLAEGRIQATISKLTDMKGVYSAVVCNSSTNESVSHTGYYVVSGPEWNCSGSTAASYYTVQRSSVQPGIRQLQAHIHTDEEPSCLEIKEQTDGTLTGSMSYAWFASLCKMVGIHTAGEGVGTFQLWKEENKIGGIIALNQASIRLPYFYNLLERASGKILIDLNNKKITLENGIFMLHQGAVRFSKITACYTDTYQLSWAHLPLVASHCLCSWGKDLFATVSFVGAIEYGLSGVHCNGTAILDKGHLHNNIFSSIMNTQGQKRATKQDQSNNLTVNITCLSRQPFQVRTPFFDLKAHLEATCKGPINDLSVNGFIHLIDGTLHFPFEPLFVRQSSIRLPQTVHDEIVVDMKAENRVKGYRIRMHIYGSLKEPQILFDATPHLEQEQIIALLCGGSADGSIAVAMSSFVMQSLQKLILGSAAESVSTLSGLKRLFKPLGSVRFVPSFTDETGRGGIRGSLAIEVNDRLRGTIKHNFSLPQDTALEVEYSLSDETLIRGFKDERGDLGGEVEASWKF